MKCLELVIATRGQGSVRALRVDTGRQEGGGGGCLA